jgi:hypothetical protein
VPALGVLREQALGFEGDHASEPRGGHPHGGRHRR